jgi:hypothetical protein
MPDAFVDDAAVETAGRVASDDGAPEVRNYVVIPVLIPEEQVQTWLDAYDPSSSTSPAAATGRVIARAVLDALKQYQEA